MSHDDDTIDAAIKPDINSSYVYDDCEVKLTGRTATQTLRSGKTLMIYEITPVHPMNGVWKKWISMSNLYKVD